MTFLTASTARTRFVVLRKWCATPPRKFKTATRPLDLTAAIWNPKLRLAPLFNFRPEIRKFAAPPKVHSEPTMKEGSKSS